MSMNKHLSPDIAEQYVIGALDAQSVRFVESHVAQCVQCAQLLQQEATLEMGLHEIGQVSSRVISLATRRRRKVGAVVASAAALLAAGLVLVVSYENSNSPSAQPQLRHCVDVSTADECISRGQFDGVITIGPNRQPIIPRYDVTVGGLP